MPDFGTLPAVENIPVVKLKGVPGKLPARIMWKDVVEPVGRIAPGTPVDVVDGKDRWVARAFYNGHARVRLRVLSRNPNEAIDRQWLLQRLTRAIDFRTKEQGLTGHTDAFRLVHSEGDDLAGLVVDKFGSLIVIEYFSAGMFRFRHAIKEILLEAFPGSTFYSFAEKHVQKQESFDYYADPIPEGVWITENGLKFLASPGNNHKTGFFVDQRENRELLTRYTENKSVLDLCCHSGGFAIYAATRGKAKSVIGVDLDPEVVALAQKNAEANSANVEFTAANLFDWIPQARLLKQLFDVLVLDPAKQTRSVERIPDALRAYHAMNRAALELVAPGGIFVTCSCSGLIREETFLQTVSEAAFKAGRSLQIFKVTGAAPDHPFLADAPESRYLKVFWGRVF